MHRATLALLLATACATPSSDERPPASGPAASASAAERRMASTPRAAPRAHSPAGEQRQGSQWDSARSLALELTRRAPENADGWLFLGMVHLKDGQVQDAITALERSVLLQDRVQARYSLGLALTASGRVDQALPHLERAVALDPGFAAGWLALARLQAMLRRFDAAAVALREARRLQPTDPELDELALTIARGVGLARQPPEAVAHHERGGRYASEGRDAEAVREYEAALKLAPPFADCHYHLGILSRRGGDLTRAEREYRAAIAGYTVGEEPLRAEAQHDLADVLVARGGSSDEALTLVREAISVRGERPAYLDTLARACDAKGDRPCAVEAWRKLLASGAELPPEVKAHAEQRLGILTP